MASKKQKQAAKRNVKKGGAAQIGTIRAGVNATIVRSARIPGASGMILHGDLSIPSPCVGVVAFAHGSGSSRHSPRNRAVAEELNGVGLATLLLDLLTEDEERIDLETRALRFDVHLLAGRVLEAGAWLRTQPELVGLGVGYFGASTGAAAALIAAAEDPRNVGAVVSRGGRPDLAGAALGLVRCPTLLIVGGADPEVIRLNRAARSELSAESSLEIVPGATHLFEEPGALQIVAQLAGHWFVSHLA